MQSQNISSNKIELSSFSFQQLSLNLESLNFDNIQEDLLSPTQFLKQNDMDSFSRDQLNFNDDLIHETLNSLKQQNQLSQNEGHSNDEYLSINYLNEYSSESKQQFNFDKDNIGLQNMKFKFLNKEYQQDQRQNNETTYSNMTEDSYSLNSFNLEESKTQRNNEVVDAITLQTAQNNQQTNSKTTSLRTRTTRTRWISLDTQNFTQKSKALYEKQKIFESYKRDIREQLGLKRLDLILKPTLRKIRKYYIQQFHTCTNYQRLKRRGGFEALKDCLDLYVNSFVQQDSKGYFQQQTKKDRREFTVLFGGMFYHTKATEIYQARNEQSIIKALQRALYVYSEQNLIKLFTKESFLLLLDHFLQLYNSSTSCKYIQKLQSDRQFNYGIQYFQKLKDVTQETL
ncbi:UNKNOWN [Stylonychia lemnae]|uniref:Uncharacterized protein n=1 Tax=Stylonychia lemnae TaxID=5949 RepID=A0A078A9Y8_STYLE|nr:UNKNOWN [Stylonychia lemnae]|eukprot:CDW78711.1 UNKNOWN [Stylonychia lemnae]